MDSAPTVFALDWSRDLGARIAGCLEAALGRHEERGFEDGEHKVRPLDPVRGRDVYVVASLYGEPDASPNDKLMRLLLFIAALVDAGAAKVTAVVPYLCYARKDRRTKPRDPLATRSIAQLFEAIGTARMVTLEVHNLAAFENAFRCETVHLGATRLFAEHFAARLGEGPVSVVSSDVGGMKRAEIFRQQLEKRLDRAVGRALMEKARSGGRISGDLLAGDLVGRTALIVDDMISTGGTMRRAAAACRAAGAEAVHLAAAHGLFMDGGAVLTAPEVESTVVCDSVPPFRVVEPVARDRLVVLDCAPLVAEAIRRLHAGESVVELQGFPGT